MSSSGRIAYAKTSWRGQPRPTSTSRAPGGRDPVGDLLVLAGLDAAELRRLASRRSSAPGTSRCSAGDQPVERRLGRAVQVDRQALARRSAPSTRSVSVGP